MTEDGLHKILSASCTSIMNSPEIVWEYVPREQDGWTIGLFTISSILEG
jgi:hypothetical protein